MTSISAGEIIIQYQDELTQLRDENLALALQVKQLREALMNFLEHGYSTIAATIAQAALSLPDNHTEIISQHDAEVLSRVQTMMNDTPSMHWGEQIERMKK